MTRRTEPRSFEFARQQLEKTLRRNAALESERDQWKAAYRAASGMVDLPHPPLLEAVVSCLLLARLVSDPQQAQVFDPAGFHAKDSTDRPMPGSSTAAARSASNHFISQLWKAVNSFQAAKERDWHRVKAPSVRCVSEGCENRRLPAWDHKGKANEFCPGCSNRLVTDE